MNDLPVAHDTSLSRRSWIVAASAFALAAVSRTAWASSRAVKIDVRRNPGCSCCEGWAAHMRKAGFEVELTDDPDLAAYKAGLGVPTALVGCHTGTAAGYVFEGHIPATTIDRFLRERPAAKGIAVAGMPGGSPGMEMATAAPYDVMAFDAQKTWLYEKIVPASAAPGSR